MYIVCMYVFYKRLIWERPPALYGFRQILPTFRDKVAHPAFHPDLPLMLQLDKEKFWTFKVTSKMNPKNLKCKESIYQPYTYRFFPEILFVEESLLHIYRVYT